MPAEGEIAIGPNGERAVFQGGLWVIAPATSAPATIPGAFVPPNPARVAERQRQARGDNLTQTRTQQEIDQHNATAGADARKAGAQANEAEANAALAQAKLAKLSGADRDFLKGLQLQNMLRAVMRARKLVDSSTSTGVVGQIGSAFWGTDATDLKNTLETVTGNVMLDRLLQMKESSPTGASGLGALTEREGRMLANSVAPLGREMSAEQLKISLGEVEQQIKRLQAVGAGFDPDDPKAAAQFNYGESPPSQLAQSRTVMEADPALKGVNARVAALMRAGRDDEVEPYLRSVGLEGTIRNIPAWSAYLRKNPDYKGPIADLERRPRTLSWFGSGRNKAAQSMRGAFVIGLADLLTAGTLDNMTTNPALTRAGMAGIADANPGSTLAGQVLGAAVSGVGAEMLAARLGAGGLAAAMAGDILPGIAYGAGSADEGGRIEGALGGGLAGMLGGFAGRGAGRVIRGAADPFVSRLNAEGVRMTPGQVLGGMGKRMEDRLAGLPLVGDMIQAQRRRGVEDFNRAAFREALAPVTQGGVEQIGEAGVGQAQQIIGDAYTNALGGHRVMVDAPFVGDMGQALNAAGALPRVGAEVRDTLDEVIPGYFDSGPPPSLTGENVQPLLQELRGFRSGYRTDPLGNRISARVGAAEDAVTGLFDRQVPEVMPAFNAANEAYASLSPVMDAVLAAKNQGGVFMPSQLGTASVAGTKRYGGRNAAARGDRPLFELQRAGQEVLPSEIHDSGTAGRWFLPGALGMSAGGGAGAVALTNEDAVEGSSGGAALGLATGAALLSPYLARGAFQRALAGTRPAWLEALGRQLPQARLPGSLALPLLIAPEGG